MNITFLPLNMLIGCLAALAGVMIASKTNPIIGLVAYLLIITAYASIYFTFINPL